MKKRRFETVSIHGGDELDQHQALNPPIYMSSTFTFTDLEQADDTFSFKRKAYVYTRGGNPTINLFERRLAELEGGVDGVAFASGMAAISSVLLSLTKSGDEIIAHRNLYGSTYEVTAHLLSRYNITTHHIDMTDIGVLKKTINTNTKVIFFETPTNPSLEIIDIAAVVKIAHQKGIIVVVDNTLATPYFQKPLDLGADIVIHSATKYLSGHGDVLGGIAVSKDPDYIHSLKFGYLCELGGVLSPFDAWLILRGIKTLGIRMERHASTAKKICDFLVKHSNVEKVIYPSIKTYPNYRIAKKQMSGWSGIISFELKGGLKSAKAFVKKLKLAKLAASFGDAETLVEIPSLMTHRGYPQKEIEKFGFSKKTIRISTGLEHPDDLIADLSQALNE